MSRLSVGIIKSGGYKLSALEIEAALLEHSNIRECAVIELPDDIWGDRLVQRADLEPFLKSGVSPANFIRLQAQRRGG